MLVVMGLYPNKPEATFDFDYWLNKHVPLLKEAMEPFGGSFVACLSGKSVVSLAAARGVSQGENEPPPFVATGHMVFRSREDFDRFFAARGDEIMEDIANYTNIEPVVSLGEVLAEEHER